MKKVGWLGFFEKFGRYEVEVTREFNGVEAKIGDVKLILTESIVVEEMGLRRNG